MLPGSPVRVVGAVEAELELDEEEVRIDLVSASGDDSICVAERAGSDARSLGDWTGAVWFLIGLTGGFFDKSGCAWTKPL